MINKTLGVNSQYSSKSPIQEIRLDHISSLILMRQLRALEVYWYLITNQPFFLFIREILSSYFVININEAHP